MALYSEKILSIIIFINLVSIAISFIISVITTITYLNEAKYLDNMDLLIIAIMIFGVTTINYLFYKWNEDDLSESLYNKLIFNNFISMISSIFNINIIFCLISNYKVESWKIIIPYFVTKFVLSMLIYIPIRLIYYFETNYGFKSRTINSM